MGDSKTIEEKPKYGFAQHPENINRSGRPKKGETYTDIIRQIGEEVDGETGLTKKQLLMRKMWNRALSDKDDLPTEKYLIDRIDGQPTQKNVIESDIIESIVEAVDKVDE